jgi:hypothetical protein
VGSSDQCCLCGIALAEIYELSSTGTRLVNISTRAHVGTGADIVIPGIVIIGSGGLQLLVRADGPGRAQFGVPGILARPTLSIFNGAGSAIASNTGRGTNMDPSQIASISSQLGAFSLAPGSADGAVVVTLHAGAYTIPISGTNGTTGVGLAEVYEVPGK